MGDKEKNAQESGFGAWDVHIQMYQPSNSLNWAPNLRCYPWIDSWTLGQVWSFHSNDKYHAFSLSLLLHSSVKNTHTHTAEKEIVQPGGIISSLGRSECMQQKLPEQSQCQRSQETFKNSRTQPKISTGKMFGQS